MTTHQWSIFKLIVGLCVISNGLSSSVLDFYPAVSTKSTLNLISSNDRGRRIMKGTRRAAPIQSSENDGEEVRLCSAFEAPLMRFFRIPPNPVLKNLARGAFLRVASDITGGTPLENVKCRVTVTEDKPIQATKNLIQQGGIRSLWSGTPSRTIEGACMGAMFLVGSTATKKQILSWGGGKTAAALAGGIVGGVVQSIIMTPAGLIFTSLNMNKGKKGYENDTAITVAQRVISEKGVQGLYAGGGAMALRQASNWASRSMFTEICRTNLKLSRFGLAGEIVSGAIGGVGSCWNTPIETVRVLMQRDVALGKPSKAYMDYVYNILNTKGPQGLFVGVAPRAIQAIWQTVFMVVVPNLMGI